MMLFLLQTEAPVPRPNGQAAAEILVWFFILAAFLAFVAHLVIHFTAKSRSKD